MTLRIIIIKVNKLIRHGKLWLDDGVKLFYTVGSQPIFSLIF